MGFSVVRKFQINVWIIIVLVLSNFLNSLNGLFNSDDQEDIHKKTAQMYVICARLKSLLVTSRLEDQHLGQLFLITFKASCINKGISGKITQNCIKITFLPINLHKLIFS